MAKPLLVIGNKNYSSWSLRPYMALKQAGIPFEEKLVQLDTPSFAKEVNKVSAAGRVPVLVHNGQSIWDTLAILEYAAETWPTKRLWPANKKARAMARSVCAEMHSGFQALRNACPMNIRRPTRPVPMTDSVLKDVARIEEIWRSCSTAHGKGGPFLFGKFSNADAMFAPVASRFVTYEIKLAKDSRSYVDAVLGSAAYQSWREAALQEPWIVKADEVD
jgi:glutathione S-transferase